MAQIEKSLSPVFAATINAPATTQLPTASSRRGHLHRPFAGGRVSPCVAILRGAIVDHLDRRALLDHLAGNIVIITPDNTSRAP